MRWPQVGRTEVGGCRVGRHAPPVRAWGNPAHRRLRPGTRARVPRAVAAGWMSAGVSSPAAAAWPRTTASRMRSWSCWSSAACYAVQIVGVGVNRTLSNSGLIAPAAGRLGHSYRDLLVQAPSSSDRQVNAGTVSVLLLPVRPARCREPGLVVTAGACLRSRPVRELLRRRRGLVTLAKGLGD